MVSKGGLPEDKRVIRVGMVGQPNVGKSMLINSMSKSKLKIGNFSGVTVEKITVMLEYKGIIIEITDLPGTYSLSDYSQEERITKKYVTNSEYDLIVNIVDSTNLKRNLILTTELLELRGNFILALNMQDEARKENIEVDSNILSKALGVPCIGVSARTKEGINNLLDTIVEYSSSKSKKREVKFLYSNKTIEQIDSVSNFLKSSGYECNNYTSKSISLLKNQQLCDKLGDKIRDKDFLAKLKPIVQSSANNIKLYNNAKNIEDAFYYEKVKFIRDIVAKAISKNRNIAQSNTSKLDKIFLNKIVGIPIFLFFMWLVFQTTFVIGNYPKDFLENLFVNTGAFLSKYIPNETLASIIGNGIFGGVGVVMSFVPVVAILFLGISILENTGYISRVSFLLDAFLKKFGLHGKAFIPLITGFGCSLPAYMALRTLRDTKSKMVAMYTIGFMSCSARLTIYILFIGAFFPNATQGNILFIIYILGALVGLIGAKILRKYVFKGEGEPFIMELPKYRLPSLKQIFMSVWVSTYMFIKKAGTFILLAAMLVWFTSSFPKSTHIEQEYQTKIALAKTKEQKNSLMGEFNEKELEYSYMGRFGKATEFIFSPLGYDWKMTAAIWTGLAAKEVVISTLGVLYSLGSDLDEDSSTLADKLRASIPLSSAISYLTFVALYLPCLSASSVFVKETSWKHFIYLFIFTSVVAWIMSFIAYNIANIFI